MFDYRQKKENIPTEDYVPTASDLRRVKAGPDIVHFNRVFLCKPTLAPDARPLMITAILVAAFYALIASSTATSISYYDFFKHALPGPLQNIIQANSEIISSKWGLRSQSVYLAVVPGLLVIATMFAAALLLFLGRKYGLKIEGNELDASTKGIVIQLSACLLSIWFFAISSFPLTSGSTMAFPGFHYYLLILAAVSFGFLNVVYYSHVLCSRLVQRLGSNPNSTSKQYRSGGGHD